jgi:uncharacterized protein (DUF1697 family)
MNAKQPELKKCSEAAGFKDVITVLSSGNIVFSTGSASEAVLERRAESAMTEGLGRTFLTIIRPIDGLQEILDADPYKAFRIPPGSKRVISFLREVPKSKLSLPIEVDGACILCFKGCQAFTVYVPNPRGPLFMTLIGKTFGEEVTTRTWNTVKRVVVKSKS